MQTEINQANSEFWNELCGSTFAKVLGITGNHPQDLQRFDEAYLQHYPYLLEHVPVHTMKNKNVLEIGLGYGTLGFQIAKAGANYHGLDIAQGPVNMMRHRLEAANLKGQDKVIQGNMLQCPLADNSMDYVVSIGCFHHTGDLQRCLDETYRVLKPKGTAYLMLYNQRSYRQWALWPVKTGKSVLRDWNIYQGSIPIGEDQRFAYDQDLAGQAAPETVFASITSLRKMLSKYSQVSFTKENNENVLGVPRRFLLSSLGKVLGTDIYFSATK